MSFLKRLRQALSSALENSMEKELQNAEKWAKEPWLNDTQRRAFQDAATRLKRQLGLPKC